MSVPFELGIVFRGFVMVSHEFKPYSVSGKTTKDLRGSFISAINTFIETAFQNTELEYLESGNTLFVFKIGQIKPKDYPDKEAVILYGLLEKTKKKTDKIVKKFLEKVKPILELFAQRYHDADFSELDQFHPFQQEIVKFFE